MTKYREILRLASLGLSQQNIALSCSVSKKTVNRILKRANELQLSWPLDKNETDSVIAEKLFPPASKHPSSALDRRIPDFNYIQKELQKNGVNKELCILRQSPDSFAEQNGRGAGQPDALELWAGCG